MGAYISGIHRLMKGRLPIAAQGGIRGQGTQYLSSNGNFPFQSAPPNQTFKAGFSSLDTLAAQRQLGWVLGGTYKSNHGIHTAISKRLSGFESSSRYPDVLLKKLKFAGDRVHRTEVKQDVWLLDQGLKVRYDIVPHPITGKVTPKGDLERLKVADIPYKKWGSEFWSLEKGEGLSLPMTWKPRTTKRNNRRSLFLSTRDDCV
jgi:hypothetical protein